MAKLHSLLLLLLVISTIGMAAYAQDQQPIKIGESLKGVTFESIFQGFIDQMCPSGNAFDCRFLDFIVAFGVVFAAIFLGLNMVETFTRAGPEAQKALNVFALLAALSTAFYVWMQKIAFFSIMASFSLFFVGLLIIMIAGNFILDLGARRSTWPKKILLIGVALITIAALLFYFKQPVIGAGLFFIGLLLAIIAFILIAIGLGGGRGAAARRAERFELGEELLEETVAEEELIKAEKELSRGQEKAALKDLKAAFKELKKAQKESKAEAKLLRDQFAKAQAISTRTYGLANQLPSAAAFEQHVITLERIEAEEEKILKEKKGYVEKAAIEVKAALKSIESEQYPAAYELIKNAYSYLERARQLTKELEQLWNEKASLALAISKELPPGKLKKLFKKV